MADTGCPAVRTLLRSTAMRSRLALVSRRFVDLRRVASQMCRSRDADVRATSHP